MLRHALFALLFASSLIAHAATPQPLKALLIAGGCCHDYAKQHEILSQGIQSRANVQVDVVWTDDKSTNPPLPLYDNPDWAKGYDIIIHDECAAGHKDFKAIKRILDVHKTVPAVHLHCAMHSFRPGNDSWYKHLGLQSNSHGPQEPIAITYVDKEHPITQPLADWTTVKEELYNNVNIFDAHPLAMGKQTAKQKDGTIKDVEYIVAWTNEKQGARSFSTTIGHNNDTVADARYLDLLTRGLLWACDKLTPDYLTPFKGQNKVTFVKGNPAPPKPQPKPAAATPPPAPKDATLVTATASSEEGGKNNFAWRAVDGDEATRWCASNEQYPQWLQLEFEKPQALTGIATIWENKGVYRYKVEGSTDGKTWSTLVDASTNNKGAPYSDDFAKSDNIKFIKIHALSKNSGGWASIREVKLKGESIKSLAPKMSAQQQATAAKVVKEESDPYKNEGNIPPSIVKLTPQQEAEILKDVKVPEGFEVTLFANSAAANYPVYVAAAPDGTLYVSSDGNGSLGRSPKRGRIIRLRDKDGDGKADETKVFCEVDSPRGLVWDHDRLYLVHPPHLSEFIDADGDGTAEKQNILVKDIAFGFKDRPADHTTNGLSLGIDGWLYIAGGDFGFMKATGTDGRTLQHRGGGVIRVRPDGTGLEIYSTGTRNILEVAISPLMDIFARDNTNDGGGWNVRFHHFTGLDDHGYPRLYKNFNDEAIQPLADYGGGSGCGAVYIDEPGFGEAWNNAPFTADWGTNAIYKHSVRPKGATFEEVKAPEPFIKMTRPTDADVDGFSRVYASSWKGATFNWAGPDVGFIVQMRPKDYKAPALPDYTKASDADLVKELESPSNRRRMEAQRQLLGRKELAGSDALSDLIVKIEAGVSSRVAATHLYFQHPGRTSGIDFGSSEDVGSQYALEAMQRAFNVPAKAGSLNITMSRTSGKKESDYSPKRASAASLVTEGLTGKMMNPATTIDFIAAQNDEVLSHLAVKAASKAEPSLLLSKLSLKQTSHASSKLLLRALAMMHKPEVVTGLIEQLDQATDPALRQGILAAICRLHFTEGEWKGDSWGTRPDTRGPYYQPEPWSETTKIAAALKEALAKAGPEEAAFLVKEMNRNRIQSDDALQRILTLAKQDPKVIPDAVAQLAVAETIPVDAIPMLVSVLKSTPELQLAQTPKGQTTPTPVTDNLVEPEVSSTTISQAIIALTKTDSAEGVSTTLTALSPLQKMPGAFKDYEAASTAFFTSPKLENHHQLIESIAEKLEAPASRHADAALLNLASRTTGSPESRELSQKALDHGWQDAKRRIQIIDAIASIKHMASAPKILAATDDPDPKVKAAAERAAKGMKLTKVADTTPKLATMTPEAAIAAVLKTKGDLALGEQVFTRATCVACHTTKESEAQKGPYLGNIAQTYKRPELAQNILDPNKTIAQGFASEMITLKDGTQQMGFITLEGASEVKLRNIAAQEFAFKTTDIKERQKLPMSMMPPGLMMNFTVREFASLLDYLEALAKK
ncbi:putative membrane-bound dehydrogenase-like protein [Prosthecobacter fusiformis]|uniref:Putative membrane-bound dehydrogenase-like protein n=1 Tax=Prosthecobacter fusiformis TaxID=48464 RepID=A0A4R7S3U6_9BACT|nr:discoidin domain-containing protein [Prosthecobacter fusiformis]TDU72964.1 putative membrane-bound dehydrogenase-like protein [Prosthecobacter fusiformis]